MKITEIRLRRLHTVVAEPLPPRGDVGYSTYRHTGSENQSLLVVEMRTDAGIVGVTAMSGWGDDPTRRIVAHFGPALLETDPTDVWSATRRLRCLFREPSDHHIANHLEFGLWDILGKERAQPLHRLLGGVTPKAGAEVYASSLYHRPLEEVLAKAHGLRKRGFRGIKVKIGHGPAEDLAMVRAIRQAIGSEIHLSLDANRAYDLEGALALVDGLADADIAWLEEPFPYVANAKAPSPWSCHEVDDWGIEQHRRLREATDIPIAGAEGFRDLQHISRLLTAGCLDIVQPDTGNLGVLAMLAAIELGNQHGATPNPHTCCDAAALVVSLHLQALTGNPAPQEYETFESPFVQALFDDQRSWVRADGTVAVPSAPGLGVELDEETCDRYCVASRIIPG